MPISPFNGWSPLVSGMGRQGGGTERITLPIPGDFVSLFYHACIAFFNFLKSSFAPCEMQNKELSMERAPFIPGWRDN